MLVALLQRKSVRHVILMLAYDMSRFLIMLSRVPRKLQAEADVAVPKDRGRDNNRVVGFSEGTVGCVVRFRCVGKRDVSDWIEMPGIKPERIVCLDNNLLILR